MKFLSSYTILIVEDEKNVRDSLEYLLKGYGATVHSSCNGIEALDFLSKQESNSVDLMITDVEMPFLNGIELLKKIHKLDMYVPTLVITGYGEKSLVQELLRIGCEDYLDKPFSKQELKEALERIIQKKQRLNTSLKTYSGEDLSKKIKLLDQKVDQLHSTHDSITDYNAPKYNQVRIWNSSLDDLGGDCFFIHQDDNFLYAVLADVAGHDMASSYYTIIVKTLFYQTCSQQHSPTKFIKELESLLPEVDDSKRMICVQYLKYDKKSQRISICSAGIPPIICLSPTNRTQAIPSYIHPPLGVYPLPNISQEEFELEAESKVFMFSDGILNSMRTQNAHKTENIVDHKLLSNWIQQNKDNDLETIINQVKSNTLRYCRNKQNDDILIVGIDLEES